MSKCEPNGKRLCQSYVIWLVSKQKRSASSPRQRSTTSTPTTAASQREQIVNCPNCGQRNRLVEVDGQSRYRCGSCHTELPNPFPSLGHAKPEPISTFRPSATKCSRAKNIAFNDASADGHLFAANDLVGVVDAFTGEALNAALGLYQCGKCQVYYHRACYEVIRSENGGQCVACLSTTIRTVSLALSPITSKPAMKGRFKTGHSEALNSYQLSSCRQGAFQFSSRKACQSRLGFHRMGE